MNDYTTCLCGRSWSGRTEAHCRKCHRHFSDIDGFDRHMTRKRCHNPPPNRFMRTLRVSGPVFVRTNQLTLSLGLSPSRANGEDPATGKRKLQGAA